MESFKVEKEFKHAKVYTVPSSPNTAIVEALTNYIPLIPFKEIFEYIGVLAKEKKLKKLIFDKRKLSIFNQPSMEWYFIEWKEKMYDQGLTIHRKILPTDDVFRQSVRIGREKINKNFPDKKYNKMDIQYAETIEEALLK